MRPGTERLREVEQVPVEADSGLDVAGVEIHQPVDEHVDEHSRPPDGVPGAGGLGCRIELFGVSWPWSNIRSTIVRRVRPAAGFSGDSGDPSRDGRDRVSAGQQWRPSNVSGGA